METQIHKGDEQLPSHGLSPGAVEEHQEKKSVLKNVKAKARSRMKKFKDSLTKHGHGHDHEHDHDHDHDHQSPDEDNDDEEELVEDPDIHGAPTAVRPFSGEQHTKPDHGQVENIDRGIEENQANPKTKNEIPSKMAEDRYDNPITDPPTRPFSEAQHTEPEHGQVRNIEGGIEENQANLKTKNEIPSKMAEDRYDSPITGTQTRPFSEEEHAKPEHEQMAEDRYDNPITGTPTRSFSEEEHAKPEHEQFGNIMHGMDENQGNPKGRIGIPTEMEEDPHAPNDGQEASNYQSKVADPTDAGGAEAGINPILRSFDKMSVHDEPQSESNPENPPKMFTDSHDQFSPEPVPENTPVDTEHPGSALKSFNSGEKQSGPVPENAPVDPKDPGSATSPVTGKTVEAKHIIASKLGYDEKEGSGKSGYGEKEGSGKSGSGEKEGSGIPNSGGESYTEKISSATSPLTGKAVAAKNVAASNLGYGEKEGSGESGYGEKEGSGLSNSGGESYTEKISSATSPLTGKAVVAKNVAASKLGYGEKEGSGESGYGEKEGFGKSGYGEKEGSEISNSGGESYTEKISSATSPLTGKAVAAKNVAASKLGYGEKEGSGESGYGEKEGFGKSGYGEKEGSGKSGYGEKEGSGISNSGGEEKSGGGVTSTVVDYGQRAAATVTGTVAGVGNSVMSKVQGGPTVDNKEMSKETVEPVENKETNKGMTGYFSEKLRPSEEDKTLSGVISDTLYGKKPESEDKPMGKDTASDELARDLGTKEGDPKGEKEGIDAGVVENVRPDVVERVKGWFGIGQSQSSQGDTNAGNEQSLSSVDSGGEKRLPESAN